MKYNSKKCIQFDDGSTRYSLKVISKTGVIFEVSSDCLYKKESKTYLSWSFRSITSAQVLVFSFFSCLSTHEQINLWL